MKPIFKTLILSLPLILLSACSANGGLASELFGASLGGGMDGFAQEDNIPEDVDYDYSSEIPTTYNADGSVSIPVDGIPTDSGDAVSESEDWSGYGSSGAVDTRSSG